MKTTEILTDIRENGGVDSRGWNLKDKKDWVKSYYECSNYITNKVANYI